MTVELRFTLHAEEKLLRLRKAGVTKRKVIEIVDTPEKILVRYLSPQMKKLED